MVLLPHLIGQAGMMALRLQPVSWAHIAEHTDLLVTFGGLRRSNTWVVPGGHDRHIGTDRARDVGATPGGCVERRGRRHITSSTRSGSG